MNYYHQANTVTNINPFQQNVDIIKNFFKKPVVLANAIFDAAIIPLTFLLIISFSRLFSTMALFDESFYSPDFPEFMEFLTEFLIIIGIVACIPMLVLVAAKFSIYFKSKNPNPNVKPSVGFTILWVFSIISVCLLGLLCFIFVISLFIAIFAFPSINDLSYYSSYDYSYYGNSVSGTDVATISLVAILIIYLIIFTFIFFYLINQLRYYQSVRKSLNSIYLKRNGAMIYGVISIIQGGSSCLSFLLYILILLASISAYMSLPNGQYIPIDLLALMTVIIGLSGASGLTDGIIAVKYAGYIKGIVTGTNQQFNANLPYSNPVPAVTFSNNAYAQTQPVQNNPFDNIQNQNPYANPQQINPQEPQAPVSDNQYYEPVGNPAPQEDTPQAEDTSQTEETFKTENNTNNNVCPNCGSPVFISDMFCNNCSTKLK